MMAILFPRSNALFLHIPKTGGSWFRQAIDRAGIVFIDYYEQHISIYELLEKVSAKGLSEKFIFSIVRHPATWYQSRWCFRVKYGWLVEHPLDYCCASNDFHRFLINVMTYYPNGWLNHLYALYNDWDLNPARVCRAENLVDDLVGVLREVGEKFDEDKFRDTPRINESDLAGKPSNYWAKYSRRLFEDLLTVEQSVISKYYQDYQLDPDKFVGELPYD